MPGTDAGDLLASPESRPGGQARRLGPGSPVAWITLAWAGMLVFFMVIVPIYQAPDEHTHVDRILSAAVVGFPEYDELRLNPELVASTRILGLSARPTLVVASATGISDHAGQVSPWRVSLALGGC